MNMKVMTMKEKLRKQNKKRKSIIITLYVKKIIVINLLRE